MMGAAPSIRGAVRLTFECVDGLAGIVEQMHEAIADKAIPLRAASRISRAGRLTEGGAYAGFRRISGLLGRGADAAIALLGESAPSSESPPSTAIAILNGIC